MRLLSKNEIQNISGAAALTNLSALGFNEYLVVIEGPWDGFYYMGPSLNGGFFFNFDGTINGPAGNVPLSLYETFVDEDYGFRNFFIATALID